MITFRRNYSVSKAFAQIFLCELCVITSELQVGRGLLCDNYVNIQLISYFRFLTVLQKFIDKTHTVAYNTAKERLSLTNVGLRCYMRIKFRLRLSFF